MENKQLVRAMLKARSEMVAPTKDKVNPMFKSKYATLDSIYNEAIPKLIENNILLVNDVEVIDGKFMATGTFIHESGESKKICFPMVIEKPTAHGMASARAYACKYIVLNGLSLPSVDDDGNAASGHEPKAACLSQAQIDSINEAVHGDVGFLNRILKAYEVTKLSEIEASEYKSIMDKIALTIKQRKAQ